MMKNEELGKKVVIEWDACRGLADIESTYLGIIRARVGSGRCSGSAAVRLVLHLLPALLGDHAAPLPCLQASGRPVMI